MLHSNTDPENVGPLNAFPNKNNLALSSGPVKPSAIMNENSLLKGQKKDSQLVKRKALGDITNQSLLSGNNTITQPSKKLKQSDTTVKPIQVFNDSTTTKSNTTNQQSSKKKLTTKHRLPTFHKHPTSTNQKPSLTQIWNEEIEFCPIPEEIPEHPTPVATERNPLTGESEDLYITLSHEKMKQMAALPKLDESYLSYFDIKTMMSDPTVQSPLSASVPPPSPIIFEDFTFDDVQ